MIELQGSSVLDSLARVERRHRAAEHMGGDAKAPSPREQLEMNPGSRTERARPFDERATRAQVDKGHRIARSQDRLRPGDGRLAESRISATIN